MKTLYELLQNPETITIEAIAGTTDDFGPNPPLIAHMCRAILLANLTTIARANAAISDYTGAQARDERADAAANDSAAPQAGEAVRILFPTHLRKMWSGGEVQAWLDEHQGVTPPKPSAKGSLERYRKWQSESDEAFGAGVNAAADLVKKMVDGYDSDHGTTDPETGTREYPGEGATWVCEMEGLEESIRALSAQPAAQNEGRGLCLNTQRPAP